MKLPSFPLTVKDENSTVKIYHLKRGKYHEFKLAYFSEGRRKTETFSDFEKAKNRADSINESVNSGSLESLALDRSECEQYRQSIELLSGTGLTLTGAITQFMDARRLLGGSASLTEAVQFFKSRYRPIIAKTVGEAKDEFIQSKIVRGVCREYIAHLKGLFLRFEETFKSDLGSLTAADITKFLMVPSPRQRKKITTLSPKTFNIYRTIVGEFFEFAKRKKYLPSDWDQMAEVQFRKVKPMDISVYTPQEMLALLGACRDSELSSKFVNKAHLAKREAIGFGPQKALRPFLAIAAFSGMRSAEIRRLRWEQIGTDSGKYIEVKSENAKMRERRLIPMTENLKAWLGPCMKNSGPVWPYAASTLMHALFVLSERAGVLWKRNALRHSYISYRVATTSNVEETSLEAGNSPDIIFKHYRAVVTSEAAAAWFSIMPGDASDKITYLKTA
jgi:integrase